MKTISVPAPEVVARHNELAALTRVLEGSRRQRGGVVFILGEAGIGKSRLAAEAVDHGLSIGMQVMRGRASAAGPTEPFRPIVEALFSLTRTVGLPDAAELVPYHPCLAPLLPEWRDPAVPSPQVPLMVMAEAVLRLLVVVGRDSGCLVVLEDLHHADPETLAILDYLTDNLDQEPVALVATVRSEAGPALDLANSAGRRRQATVVEPRRLSRPQVSELIASCLDIAPSTVPDVILDLVFKDSEGVPFVVEELLNNMAEGGQLVAGTDGWTVDGEFSPQVPATVALSITHRVQRLGADVTALLNVAAVLGNRFPLSVAEAVLGLGRDEMLVTLHAAVAAQLVGPDQPVPDWYAFRHALTADALLSQLVPGERTELARKVAAVVEDLHPGLPGAWCTIAAGLRQSAGDGVAAGRLFAEAGRRTLDEGRAASSVELLQRAQELLVGPGTDRDERIEVLEALLRALAEAGKIQEALDLVSRLEDAGLSAQRRASLHGMLALVAVHAGLWEQGAAEVEIARALLGPGAAPRHTARLDVIAAKLTMEIPGGDRRAVAERLGRRALKDAERAGLVQVTCESLELLGALTRQTDLTESDAYFERIAVLADEHQLPAFRLKALARSGVNQVLRSGQQDLLRRAHAEALRLGAVSEAHVLETNLVMVEVLAGNYAAAARLADNCLPGVRRMRLRYEVRYGLMAKATMFAHQGQRRNMEQTIEEFRSWGGDQSHQAPLVHGLCEAFCALLEENRYRAMIALDDAVRCEDRNPTNYVLAGRHGLRVLLGVLDSRMGWPEQRDAAASPAGKLAWNRGFLLLAEAVLHGRDRRAKEADSALAEAAAVAAVFPLARHLGLRMVADAALADGWGDPAGWLRHTELFFHAAGIPAVAGACRMMLRQAGATVPQRRAGSAFLPARLREQGVTVREFEVLKLVAEQLGNTEIGRRLYISPRTVEKHVASLIAKTGLHDRNALERYAADAAFAD